MGKRFLRNPITEELEWLFDSLRVRSNESEGEAIAKIVGNDEM